jgi:hypothetical protein
MAQSIQSARRARLSLRCHNCPPPPPYPQASVPSPPLANPLPATKRNEKEVTIIVVLGWGGGGGGTNYSDNKPCVLSCHSYYRPMPCTVLYLTAVVNERNTRQDF